jgi:hypothetical protein
MAQKEQHLAVASGATGAGAAAAAATTTAAPLAAPVESNGQTLHFDPAFLTRIEKFLDNVARNVIITRTGLSEKQQQFVGQFKRLGAAMGIEGYAVPPLPLSRDGCVLLLPDVPPATAAVRVYAASGVCTFRVDYIENGTLRLDRHEDVGRVEFIDATGTVLAITGPSKVVQTTSTR